MGSPNTSTAPVLRFRSRAGFERVFEIPTSGTRIGSRADADIRIGIPGIPSQACVLIQRGSDLVMTEVSGTTVWVDGEPAKEGQSLPSGSTLTIGPAHFSVEHPETNTAALGHAT